MKELNKEQRAELLASPKYKPAKLLKQLAEYHGVTTDSALAKAIGITGPMLCNIRSKKYPLTPHTIVAMLDTCPELTLADLRKTAGFAKVKA